MVVVLKCNFVLSLIFIDQFKAFILQLKTEQSLPYFVENQVTPGSRAICENLKNCLRRFCFLDILPPGACNFNSHSF